MSLKSNDAWTRAKCRREFVKVETSRLLQQEAGAATGGRGEGWGRGGGEVGRPEPITHQRDRFLTFLQI